MEQNGYRTEYHPEHANPYWLVYDLADGRTITLSKHYTENTLAAALLARAA